MTKKEKIAQFDPNKYGIRNEQLFGLPFNYKESDIIILPVPWDVTTSYQAGTSQAPKAILNASPQLDLYDPDFEDAWKMGIFMQKISEQWLQINHNLRKQATTYIDFLENGGEIAHFSSMQVILQHINEHCERLKNWVTQQSRQILADGKLLGILGGEHSVPLGAIKALCEKYPSFGILQIDAHADLRPNYEGFIHSHASIFYNALKQPQIEKLIAVGVRDICEAEVNFAKQSRGRVEIFYDWDIKEQIHIRQQQTWAAFCTNIVSKLPQKVYISFDIDGLDPKLCPNTGTAVAGGLQLYEAFFLIKTVVESGREIIGFDLCEVAPNLQNPNDEWDANVGARVLYKLAILMKKSQLRQEI